MVRRRQGVRPSDAPVVREIAGGAAVVGVDAFAATAAAYPTVDDAARPIEASVTAVANAAHPTVAAAAAVGVDAVAAAVGAPAGSRNWSAAVGVAVVAAAAGAHPTVVDAAHPNEASATAAADAAHPIVAAAAAAGVDAFAAAAGAPAGSRCWCGYFAGATAAHPTVAAAAGAPAGSRCRCSCCAPVSPPMVRRRRGARPSDGPASLRRRTIEASVTAAAAAAHPSVAATAAVGLAAAASTVDAAHPIVAAAAAVGVAAVAAAAGAHPTVVDAAHPIEASVAVDADAAHLTVAAAAAVGLDVVAAGARDPAGSHCWCSCCAPVFPPMVRRPACSSGVSTPKVVGRAVTFQEKYWAIDWHLGMKVPCCGPVVFLRDQSGGYYPCGGIKTYSFDKNMPDEEYMRFHLTTCFDIDGHEVPDNYKLVSLHVEKFQRYGIRAASMSPFDKSKKKDASQMVMLRPFEFLKRVNCYKVSNYIVTIDNNLQLSNPFVPFDCDLGDFADMVRRHKLQAMGQAILRTTVSVSSPKAVGKSCGEPKTSACMSKSAAASTQAKSVRKSASLLQPKGVSAPQAPSHAEYAACVSLTPPGGATNHEDDDENVEEDSRFFNSDGGRWPDGNDAKDTEGDKTNNGSATVHTMKREAWKMASPKAMVVKAKRIMVMKAMGVKKKKMRMQVTRTPQNGKTATKGGAKEMRVGRTTTATGIEGRKKGGNSLSVPQVMTVRQKMTMCCIAHRGVQYNHRPLNEMLVTSIRDAMKHPEKQKEWDRNTWILAPVVEVQKDGRKQWERVKPEEWDDDKVASYHWYAVAGQHTAKAAKRLVAAKSSAAHKWGVHSWKARVVYFDDDHLEGYAYISTFNNTRETRVIPSSFRMAVTAIRGMWQSMKESKGDWHQAKTVEERTA
ncbi:hypothetical protein CBR_g12900 [Chara braunii]|uniref:Uncharacterized protein n=1 Tax=Chara braunii TaxID=69332 RepID=A0A388KT49_CHABU|nr:hypothetical protein CBR_g12900 [Chara braunii]|eukprot:GBG73182.1 hypothetical protein CBR_g12900 [Chara braunii]